MASSFWSVPCLGSHSPFFIVVELVNTADSKYCGWQINLTQISDSVLLPLAIGLQDECTKRIIPQIENDFR